MQESPAVLSRKRAKEAAKAIKARRAAKRAEVPKQIAAQRKEFHAKISQLARLFIERCRRKIASAEKSGKFSATLWYPIQMAELEEAGYPLLPIKETDDAWWLFFKKVKNGLGKDGYDVELKKEVQKYEDDGYPCERIFRYFQIKW